MSAPQIPEFSDETDLKIERIVELSPHQMYKAYTTPSLLKQWFCPVPWKVTECEVDLRPGGNFYTVMSGPAGERMPTSGCFLEIVPDKKLVWTDAMTAGFRPAENPFITVIITFEDLGSGNTKYTAIAKHKNADTRKSHQDMGFETGWNVAIDQMIILMKAL